MSIGSGAGRRCLGTFGRRPVRPSARPRGCPRSDGPAHLPARPEQVVDEQHPDQVVEIVAVDRKTAVARLADRLGDGIDGQRDRQGDHVHPGGHHLADHRVVQVVEGVDDELLLGVGAALGRPARSPLFRRARCVRGGDRRPLGSRGCLLRGVGARTRW